MEGPNRQGGRVRVPHIAILGILFSLLGTAPAGAANFSLSDDDLGWGNWGQIDFTWNTRLTAGVQVRTERRDSRLIDKQNVDGNQDIYISGDTQKIDFPFGVEEFFWTEIPDPGPFEGRFDLCEIGLPGWYNWNQGMLFGLGETDCMSALGDPRPGQRMISAPGGYNINGDDGNLNYDRGDITYANFQIRSELTAHWQDLTLKVSGIGYYDPVNNDFDTHLADREKLEYSGRTYPTSPFSYLGGRPELQDQFLYPTGNTVTVDRSGFTQRQDDEEDRLGEQLRLLEAYVAYNFDIGGRNLRLAVGDQRMRWGESTFMIFNNLARINPPSAELYDRPGTEVRDAFIPVGMVTASMNVTTNFNIEAFYQYDWEPVEPSVAGSFLSVSDVAGAGEGPTPVYLASGNAPEAPNAALEVRDASVNPADDYRLGGLSGTQTHTSRTLYLEDESFGYPEDGGQFGLRLDYYADWLNGGTELSLYGMNIHSRLPYFSVLAASCHIYGNNFSDNPCDANGSSGPDLNYRVDSMRAFLDYPEDVRVFGLSATTNVGDWSLAGELSYSPNQPAQVSVVDVVYAGVQPALSNSGAPYDPREGELGTLGNLGEGPYDDDIDIPFSNNLPQQNGNPPGVGIAGMRRTQWARIFTPDYLMSRYRCDLDGKDYNTDDQIEPWEREVACSQAIKPGEYIRGYERLKVGQIALTGIRVLGGSNLINADQIIFVGEFAATKVFDMPGLDEVQFQGSTASQTHYSQGQADWTPDYGPFAAEAGSSGSVSWEEGDILVNADGELRDEYREEFDDIGDFCGVGEMNSSTGGCYRQLGPTDRANPERADEDDFADDFAMGYRMRVTADYNNGPFGWKWTPGFTFYHDVHGTSISPGQDFVEDRKRLTLHTNVLFTNNFSGNFQYRFYWGAGDRNLRLDRDYAELSLSYAF